MQELCENLVDPGVPAEQADDDDQFKKALRMFNAHFEVTPNTPYERHLFRQISFQDGETCDHFVVRLRQQARHCDFGQAADDFIRDQLIDKVPNAGLKKKLLEERNITLKRALEVARTWEAAGQQASRMSLASPSINAIRSSSRRADHTREQRTAKDDCECFNCGRRGHISKDLTCPARGKKCSKCQKLGHFAVKCRSTGGKFSASVRPKRRAGGRA